MRCSNSPLPRLARAVHICAMPSSHEITITGSPDDIDELGHVNNAVWVKWIQHVAVEHWRAARVSTG